MSFHYSIVSYDFHTYFKLDDPAEIKFAQDFKESIDKEFKEELANGQIRLFKTFNQAIGPHPDGYGMFESDTRSPDKFLKMLNYYQLNHGELSVLIHPRSDQGGFLDHTKNALWLGDLLKLKTDFLKREEASGN